MPQRQEGDGPIAAMNHHAGTVAGTSADYPSPEEHGKAVKSLTSPTSPNPKHMATSNYAVTGKPATTAEIAMSTLLIDTLWPTFGASCDCNAQWPLQRFITETLRRSRTTAQTLHAALYYHFCLKAYSQSTHCTPEIKATRPFYTYCGRRTFLTSLMVASKFCNDKNYSISSWSKISGLPKSTLLEYEKEMLRVFNYRMWIPMKELSRLIDVLLLCLKRKSSQPLIRLTDPLLLPLIDRQVYKTQPAQTISIDESLSLLISENLPLTPCPSPAACCDDQALAMSGEGEEIGIGSKSNSSVKRKRSQVADSVESKKKCKNS